MSTYVRYPASQGLVSAVTNPLVLTSGTLSILDAGAAQAGIVSTGTQTFGGSKTFNGDFFLGSNFTFSQANDAVTTGANANIASHTTTMIRLTNASLTSVASIGTTGVVAGHLLIIVNVTGSAITLINNYGSAPVGSALRTGNQQNMTLQSSGSVFFVYDGTSLNWKVIATPPFVLDGLDSVTKTASGAALSGNTLYMQTADGTYPGLVSTAAQTFAGAKTFSSPVLAPAGSVSAPGLSFSSETNTGIYLDGALDMALAVNGQQALNLLYNAANQVNWGIGTAAVSGAGNYFVADRVYNGDVYYQWANTSSGTASATVFDVLNGPASNHLYLENRAYTTSGYLAGGCALAANSNMTQLNIMAEYASAYIAFNVGGRTLATERARLTATELSLVKIPLAIGGSTSGYITHAASATTTSHTLTWPASQGGASTVLQNDGAGNLSWASGGSGTVTSVAMSVPAFLSVSGSPITSSGTLAVSLSGTALPIANGGTGATTASAAFDALSPMTTLGDTIFGGASGTRTRLAGNTTTTKKYLAQTGDGANSAAPAWSQPAFSELSGSVAASQMPALTGDVTTSAGAVATTIANSAVTNAKMANMATNTIKGNNTGGSAAPSDLTVAQTAAMFSLPTLTKYTSGSGTYTTPSNCRWIRVTVVGGGGGGAGGGASAGGGGNGGQSYFNTTSGITGNGGSGGGIGSGVGGAGGAGSLGTGPIGYALTGTTGRGGLYDAPGPAQYPGGSGGGSAFFGGGGATANGGAAGSGIANTGGGGGGGCIQSTTAYSGTGGGGGGCAMGIITSPGSSYTYGVGSGGSGGSTGTNGGAGGSGGAGIIIIEEYYI